MFGLGKKQAPATNQPADDSHLDVQILTMKGDQATPFKGETLSIDVPVIKPLDPTQEKKPEKKEPTPAQEDTPSPFLTQKVSSLPEQSVHPEIGAPPVAANQPKQTIEPKIENTPAPKAKIEPEKPSSPASVAGLPDQKFPAPNLNLPNKPLVPNNPLPLEKIPAKTNANQILLIAASVVLLLTIGAGAYYYFVILGQEEATQQAQTEQPDSTGTETSTTDPTTQTPTETTPTAINLSPKTITTPLENNDLVATLKSLMEKESQNEAPSLSFYSFTNDQNQTLTAKDLMTGLNISLPEVESDLSAGWVAITNIPGETVKLTLLFQASADLKEKVQTLEANLITNLAGIYFNEATPIPSNTTFNVSPIDSRVRFFNFVKDDPTLSLDWTSIPQENAFLLIFSASREAMQKTLSEF